MYIENLSKIYKMKEKTHYVLNNVSLTIPKNSIYGLLGNNGAGKTTLIKCIVGLITPDNGKIVYQNNNILQNYKARLEHISVLLDGGRNLYLYMTVEENIRYFSMLNGIKHFKKSDNYKLILQYLDIDKISNKLVNTLSFGMRQRAALAVSLVCGSDIIILDEPTTGLDIVYRNELIQLLIKLKKDFNKTIILSSHDIDFINSVCDWCCLLDQGKIIKDGDIKSFLEAFDSINYTLSYRDFLENRQINILNKVLNIINIDFDRKEIDILWNKGKNVTEMLKYFHELDIYVNSIKKNSSLKSVILALSGKVMSEVIDN